MDGQALREIEQVIDDFKNAYFPLYDISSWVEELRDAYGVVVIHLRRNNQGDAPLNTCSVILDRFTLDSQAAILEKVDMAFRELID